jgi:phage shock protein C
MEVAPSIFARDDTLFGVCAALGEDFGFSPTYLRILVALVLFWNPVAAAAGYAACGALVAISRWLVPNPPQARNEDDAQDASEEAEAQVWEELALAA